MSSLLHNAPMHANNREALEIFEYLKKKLSLPDNVVEFTLTYRANDLLAVECSYYPRRLEDDAKTV